LHIFGSNRVAEIPHIHLKAIIFVRFLLNGLNIIITGEVAKALVCPRIGTAFGVLNATISPSPDVVLELLAAQGLKISKCPRWQTDNARPYGVEKVAPDF